MNSPLGMIAGSGNLPLDLAARAEADGRPLFVVRIQGHADPELDRYPGLTMPIGKVGRAIAALRSAGCRQAMFTGKVLRPSLHDLVPDWGGIRVLMTILTGAWGKDDALHRAIATLFERRGIRIVGPAEVWPDMLAPDALLTRRPPSPSEWTDIRTAAASALDIGAKDIGQGAIARDGITIAVEDRTHTNGLLRRVSDIGGRGGVLVKCAKPQQDRRVDLPVIGPDTVRLAAEAGLSGIAIEAGASILARRDELIEIAEHSGLFVLGFTVASLERASQ